MREEISYYTRLHFIPTSTMGLITKEIDYDHQLKQLTSEMTVTAELNEHQQRTFTHKL
jgi:hypothetical protein